MSETLLEEEASDAVPRAARVSLRPMAEQPTSERTVSESVKSFVSPEIEVVTLSPSMQLRMRAAQLLREKGWCQKAFSETDGSLCILGALTFADDPNFFPSKYGGLVPPKILTIANELCSRFGIPSWRWNDEPGRTKEQVIALLEGRDWEAVEGDEANERRGAAAPSAQSAGLGPTDGDGS